LHEWHRQNEASRRLAAVPGIGVITATAIVATVSDPGQFRSGRQFAAWLGLVPKQNSSGERQRLSGISKQGDRYLRRLLVVGATAVIRHNRGKETPAARWLETLLEKKSVRLVSVALANKTARIAWALLARGVQFNPYRIGVC
jgi:transposase